MRLLLSAIAGLVLAACDDAPPAATLKEIPAAFVGSWDGSAGDCGGGGALAVTITPTEVRFPDSRIDVTGVAPDGSSAARVDGHFTSADAQWDGAVRLELADGGKVLNVVNGSALSPRVKCS
jgi:hypothetical protein